MLHSHNSYLGTSQLHNGYTTAVCTDARLGKFPEIWGFFDVVKGNLGIFWGDFWREKFGLERRAGILLPKLRVRITLQADADL